MILDSHIRGNDIQIHILFSELSSTNHNIDLSISQNFLIFVNKIKLS